MPRLSVLDLEQRIDPIKEYKKLNIFLNNEVFIDLGKMYYNPKNFIEYINEIMLTLPYCGSSNSFSDY